VQHDLRVACIKKKYGNQQAVLEAPQRIRWVCIDILRHYREHIQPNGFKAMIVTSSRSAAITYKEQIDALQGPETAVIISGDHNDEKRYWDYTDPTKQKKQIEDFKKPLGSGDNKSNLSILIVNQGKNYRLKFVRGGEYDARMKNGFLEVSIPKSGSITVHQSAVKERLVAWYQSHAEERFLTKANRFMKQMGVSPAKVSVRDFKSRWGSCTVRGDVTFNWRVIMAPNRVMDYVVVHELAHLVAHDHSEKFWKTIRKVIPDYPTDKEWLRANGKTLFLL